MNQKGQTQVLILAGIVLLIAVAGGIFFLGRATAPKPQSSPLSTEAPAKVEDPTANWKIYTNDKYKFLIKYPSSLTLKEDDFIPGTSVPPGRYTSELTVWFIDNQETMLVLKSELNPYYSSFASRLDPVGSTEVNGLKWIIYPEDPTYADAGNFGKTHVTYETEKNNIRISFILTGLDQSSPIFNQILSTFRFLF